MKIVLRASKELKCRDIVMITWDYDEVEMYDNINIKYIPLWKWFTKITMEMSRKH